MPSDSNVKKTIPMPKQKKERSISTFGIGKEKTYLIDNLSLLLSSGIGIVPALRSIQKEVKSVRLKKILERAEDDVESGMSLWRVLSRTKLVPDHIISFIRIGEESGKLADNLRLIAVEQEKERLFHSKLRSALMYPLLVLSLAFVIGILIAWFILPRLATLFSDLKLTLPTITKGLIFVGRFLGEYGTIVVPLSFVFLCLVLFFLFVYSKTRHIGQGILFHTPVIGRLMQEVELGRMGYVVGMLLEAGIPIIDAIESLRQGTPLTQYRKLYGYWRKRLEEGDSFRMIFASYKKTNKLIPIPVQQMIVSGEESGQLYFVFKKIGTNFEGKTEATSKNISVLLEPLLLFIVWIAVIGVALAVILPIYSLIGGLNTNPT